MRKYLGYIPAAAFTAFYLFASVTTGVRVTLPVAIVFIISFWVAGVLLHKGLFYGSVAGLIPSGYILYLGIAHSLLRDIVFGVVLLVFYGILAFISWKKRGEEKVKTSEVVKLVLKIFLTILALLVSFAVGIIASLYLFFEEITAFLSYFSITVIPSLFLPLIWLKKRKRFTIIWVIVAFIYFVALSINFGLIRHEENITINTAPNINVHEYLPFTEESKIVKAKSESVHFSENPPRIDGAAALFPVYSAFVNATYPETTTLNDGAFLYNNTPGGYKLLAEKGTDIFIGVYPSEEQIAYSKECNTTFEYTPIGSEAFVFFVHKDNPIDNLTTEQLQAIYSGEITNWKDLGGRNEEIAAFQRNEGSGSQSMLKRFMGDKPIMEAPKEMVNDMMSGIIEKVSDYKSRSNSIGFSFRFYVEGIIKNPDIKMLSIDGVKPTAENIKNGSYNIVTPIYAVTYKENENENVKILLEWILSEEGQKILEESGYVGVR